MFLRKLSREIKAQITTRAEETKLMAKYVQIPDYIDLQRRADPVACGSMEVAKDIVAEPLHGIHVRIRSRHALLATQIQSAKRSEHVGS